MIDRSLREKLLDAPLIIQGYVKDEPKCNYELYLTELLNYSTLFKQKSKGSAYHFVDHQDHGEPDAFSDNYSIDFKLFATRSLLQGLRETSSSITKIKEGAFSFGVGRWPKEQLFTYIRTVAALRQYSIEDLYRIAVEPADRIENEVSIILKSLRVQKNLLLFYPYIMMFSEPHTFEEGCNSIYEAFNDDLYNVDVYRRNEALNLDTYLCVVYEKRMLIFELIGNSWQFKDYVDLELSSIFTELFYTYGNNGCNF